jgi:hypothetical protein
MLFLGCSSAITGLVQDSTGAPLAGVALIAPTCSATSGKDGRFLADCEVGNHSFAIDHPGYLPNMLSINSSRWGQTEAPPVILTRIPTDPGFYITTGRSFTILPPSKNTLFRKEIPETNPTQILWCTSSSPTPVASRRWLEVKGGEWRIFKVGGDGCFYTLSWVSGTQDEAIWSPKTEEIKLSATDAGEGRQWLESPPPGRYVIAEWLGTFIPEPGTKAEYRGWFLEVTEGGS